MGDYSAIVKVQETDVWAEDEYGETLIVLTVPVSTTISTSTLPLVPINLTGTLI